MGAIAHSVDRETRDQRFDYPVLGQVVENELSKDSKLPKGLGAIRVFVPGLYEPKSVPAYPLCAMWGVKNGLAWVPEEGANVVVFFIQGHYDHPFYLPAMFGKPGGVPQVPDESQGFSPDIMALRWREFVLVMNGKPGEEKLTVEDLHTQTKLELIRSTGNFERVVTGPQGDEVATIKRHLQETVQTGNETHNILAGKRDTLVAQNDTKVVGGNKIDNVTGNEQKTIGGARSETVALAETKQVGLASTETIGLAKAITAGLSIALTAGANIALTAVGAVTIIGAQTTMQSAGPSANISAGLQTNTLLGGIVSTIIGAVTKVLTGAYTFTVSGIYTLIAPTINLGAGTLKPLLKDLYHDDYVAPHLHTCAAPGSLCGQAQIPDPNNPGGYINMPSTLAPGDSHKTTNLNAS